MTSDIDEIPKLPRHRKPKNKPIGRLPIRKRIAYKDSSWRQQRLNSRRPVLTITTVGPSVVLLGLVLLGLGLVLYFAVNDSLEIVQDYTDCLTADKTPAKQLALENQKPQCTLPFVIKGEFKGNIKFYYQLDGFYQNFRTYTASRNDRQLDGDLWQTDGCDPMDCRPVEGKTRKEAPCNQQSYKNQIAIPYVPCGVIANSMFNDSFEIFYHKGENEIIPVPFSTKGVLSDVERKKKFKNPSDYPDDSNIRKAYPGNGCDQFENTLKPDDWEKPICELGPDPQNDTDHEDVGWGLDNIDFQVWMKTAALPNFRKPYRSLNADSNSLFNDQPEDKSGKLPEGNYSLVVNYNYNVDKYGIRKSFVIVRTNWIGPRNFFLPGIYMATGIFLVLSTSILMIVAKLKQRYSPNSMQL